MCRSPAGISRRCPDDRQSLHPAGAALRVRARRPTLHSQRPADARRHGAHLRRRRFTGGRRPAAGRSPPTAMVAWPRWRCSRCSAWRSCSPALRAPDAASRGPRSAVVAIGRQGRRSEPPLLGPARRRGGSALGAVCRPRARVDPDRRGAPGREHRDEHAASRLRGGAATSLALALLVGGRVFAAMKRSLGAGEWIRRASARRSSPQSHRLRSASTRAS